jgi:phosphomevalonate kinase
MRLSVPGNLLLLGEYAVLEKGGLGLAVAVERRLIVEAGPAPALTVTGSWSGGADLSWSAADPAASPLITEAVSACEAYLASIGRALPVARVRVDSSSFYVEGRKSGFGSSAAVAVGLVWTLLALSGDGPDPRAVSETALRAHRRAQGGRGSGYDVLASSYGGVGLFTGGERPAWEPLRLSWLAPLFLYRGPRSVSTPRAIDRYRQWRDRYPREADAFLRESNRHVLAFARSRSRAEAASWLARSRELGMQLGERIGVDASLAAPEALPPGELKALGAGNELGLYFPDQAPEPLHAGLIPMAVASEGPLESP